jgi:hypothetical protein
MLTRNLVRSTVFAAAGFAAILSACPAMAQTYDTQVLADLNTARPDGQGNFNVYWTVAPAIDGDAIAFVNSGPAGQEYWSANVANPAKPVFTKLLDTTTKAPGGNGAFSNFVPPNNNLTLLNPKIQNGKLFFWAEDHTGANGFGLYWINFAGGPVHKVVNYRTARPEGGTFGAPSSSPNNPDQFEAFYASGNLVLFDSSYGETFVGATAGSAPVVVADGNTKIYYGTQGFTYGCYAGKAIDGVNVAVSASNCFDPSRGLNVMFVGPYNHFASPSKLPVVTSDETLPGDADATPHLDVISDNAFLSGNLLYFGGIDTFSTASGGFYGFYFAPFGADGAPLAPGGSPIERVFDNVTSGLTGSFGSFGGTSFAQGTTALIATDTASNVTGLYMAATDMPNLISTNLQRGVQAPLGISNGRLAFGGAGFFDQQLDFSSPASCRVASVPAIKVTRGAVTAGAAAGEYQQVVTLRNSGEAAVTGPIDLALTSLTDGVALLNRSGVTFCTAPAGTPYVTASASGTSMAAGAKILVTLDWWSPATATVSYKPVVLSGAGAP